MDWVIDLHCHRLVSQDICDLREVSSGGLPRWNYNHKSSRSSLSLQIDDEQLERAPEMDLVERAIWRFNRDVGGPFRMLQQAAAERNDRERARLRG